MSVRVRLKITLQAIEVRRAVTVKQDLICIRSQSLVAYLMLEMHLWWIRWIGWESRAYHSTGIWLHGHNRLAEALILIKLRIIKKPIWVIRQSIWQQQSPVLVNITSREVIILRILILRRNSPDVNEILMDLSVSLRATSHSRRLWSQELRRGSPTSLSQIWVID
jgi:hypothetical protein